MSVSVLPATAMSAGDAPRFRYYEGPTSEGGRLRMSVRISDGVARLDLLLIDGPYRCADVEGEVETGAGWGHGSPVIADHHLDLSGETGRSSRSWCRVASAPTIAPDALVPAPGAHR